MLIVLPPSEGKTAPAHGPRLDLGALSATQLAGARRRVLGALADVSARPDALDVLGVGAAVADDVARNTRLTREPVAPSARVYSGVLYAAARLEDLTGEAAERASARVRIVSALWGVVSPADPIPAYRLSMGTTLPEVGRLATYWRRHLGAVLDPEARGQMVVDCRSAAYAAAWAPPLDAEHVTVGVVRETGGRRQVVSHNAKHARGLLTHHLLTRPGPAPRTAEELAEAAAGMAGVELRGVELAPPSRGRRPLTLVV